MKFEEFKKSLYAGSDEIICRETELCDLDSFVGDGDHGVTVRKGYQNVKKAVDASGATTIADMLYAASDGLGNTSGGAIGPILASMFLGFAMSTEGKDDLGVKDLADMFSAGLDSVQSLGGAQPGDSTMVDTLYPFVQSMKAATTDNVKEALEAAAEKGFEGSESTKTMAAKLGRAKNLAEKSIGYVDAGSRSMYYFLKGFADAAE